MTGEWLESTAPSGHYQGRTFEGLLHFIMSDDGNTLKGLWTGANSANSRIKSGEWVLRRILKQAS